MILLIRDMSLGFMVSVCLGLPKVNQIDRGLFGMCAKHYVRRLDIPMNEIVQVDKFQTGNLRGSDHKHMKGNT